jgi:hypothetical protein
VSAFDEATHLGADGVGAILDGWDIGGNANGGYLLALAANGMRTLAGRPDPVTITAHFLAPGRPGSVRVDGTVVKSGKRFATVSGSLSDGDRTIIQVLATFGDLTSVDDIEVVHGAPPELAPRDQCRRRQTGDGGFPVALMDKIRVELDPRCAGFVTGQPSGNGEIVGWFSFVDDRPIDPLALLLVADAFPPAVFDLNVPSAWVPTVELTVHVRARPAPGPLRCRFRTRFVQGGMLEEDGEMWDEQGTLVAMSRQLALLPRVP